MVVIQEKLQQIFFRGGFLSLHQDVSHGLDVLVVIITIVRSFVSTRVVVIRFSSSNKPNSGVTKIAVVFIVTKYTDSYSGLVPVLNTTISIEPFLVIQLYCKEALEPISDFHVSQPSEVAR